MPARTMPRIFSISGSVALRFTSPTTSLRIVPCPTKSPKFGVMRIAAIRSRNGLIGNGEDPSGPSMSVVTPWRT